MGGVLPRNMLEKAGLWGPDAPDHDDECADNDEGAPGEVHEFPGFTESEVSKKKEVTGVQSQSQAPIPNRIKVPKSISYNDTPETGDSLCDNIPAVLNLSYIGKSEGRRMIDFMSGLCFGLEGKLELVGENLFLLTPRGTAMITDREQTPSSLPSRY